MILRGLLLLSGLIIWLAARPSVSLEAQTVAPQTVSQSLTVVGVKPNIHMIAGAGGNVLVHVGANGAIVVDTGRVESADALLAEIRRLTSQPIRYIINTSADPDHVGGNATLSLAGRPFNTAQGRPAAAILAEEHVLTRMSAPTGQQAPYPQQAWPTSTYAAAAGETHRKLVINGDAVQVMYHPSAHTDGDSLVYFRRSDVLVTGDLVDLTRFPMIDRSRGGSVQGVLGGLNRIIDMTFSSTPFTWQDDGTLIVPGHGRLATVDDIISYRDMLAIVHDRVANLIRQGRTLEQVQQANPTAGYRRHYGTDQGLWTTRMFVEAVYASLTAERVTR